MAEAGGETARGRKKWEIPPKTASEENEAKVGSSHSQAKKNLLKNPRERFWWDLKKVVAPGDPRNIPQMEVMVPETIPFRGHIVGGLHPGKKVSVIGIVDSHPDRFYVSLTCGYGTSGQDITDVALEICVLFSERQVRRRARVAGLWEDATRTLPFFPFIKGEAFKMEIFCERSRYRVFVDGEQLFDFKHRVTPLDGVDALWIKGSIVITKLS